MFTLDIKLFNSSRQIKSDLARLLTQGTQIMALLDTLKAQVEANKVVSDSAIVLLQGLKAKFDAALANGDPAAIQALSDSLGTETAALAAAVTANTPTDGA